MTNSPRAAAPSAEGNPFSTRHIRPGAIEYLFPEGSGPKELVARLRDNGWRGEIVGPHGSGKSSLLAALLPHLQQSGRAVVHIALHAGQRRLPITTVQSRSWNGDTLLVIDGYEQLSWWSRRWLDLTCRRLGSGLLITAHKTTGLPPLVTTSPSLDVMQSIVTRLLPAGCTLISPADVDRCFAQQGGNARETLFALYDLYELRRGK